MANFTQHLDHSLSNIQHLSCVNDNVPTEFRWQVTLCHYVALHLMHAFLSDKSNLHPENHNQLKDQINPSGRFKATRIDSNIYVAYESLENESRKARYSSEVSITVKHLANSLTYLDSIIDFFKKQYPGVLFPEINIICDDTKRCSNLKHIKIVEKVEIEKL